MAAYSQDLRERVLRGLERGDRPTEIARRLEVSRAWVYQVRNRLKATGERHSHQIGGYRQSRLAGKEALLREWINERADLTLEELGERLKEHGIEIKATALWHQLDNWGLTYKTNPARQRTSMRRRAKGKG